MAPVILYFFYAGAAAGFAALYGLLITLVANVIVAFFFIRSSFRELYLSLLLIC